MVIMKHFVNAEGVLLAFGLLVGYFLGKRLTGGRWVLLVVLTLVYIVWAFYGGRKAKK